MVWYVNKKPVPFTELEDSHLLHIIKWIEKKAEEGRTSVTFIGVDEDFNNYDNDGGFFTKLTLKGAMVTNKYPYKELLLEARNRDLMDEETVNFKLTHCPVCRQKKCECKDSIKLHDPVKDEE